MWNIIEEGVFDMTYVWDLGIGLVSGIVSGIITGFLVNYFVKKREEKAMIYKTWMSFLFKTLEKCEIYIDFEKFEVMPKFKKENKVFRDAVFSIYDNLHPLNHTEKEYTDEEIELFENIKIAMSELGKWKDENKFWL